MGQIRKKHALTHKGAELKTRVARTRSRAQFVGIIYLISIVALAAIACFPLFDVSKQANAPLGVFEFWKAFMPESFTLKTRTGVKTFVIATLYAVMLLVMLINVVRAGSKLTWLYKKKVSKTYGFNRNVYAMDDLGKIFSGSYAILLITYFAVAIICRVAYPNLLMYLTFIVGALVHVFAGVVGGKASYFNVEEGQITEDARVVGRFAAFFRNVLQLVAVFVMMDYFQKFNILCAVSANTFDKVSVGGKMVAYIPAASQLLAALCMLPLIKHATATTEYNIDGVYGAGMKTFRVFCFLLCGVLGAGVVAQYLIGSVVYANVDGAMVAQVVKSANWDAVIVVGIAFVMFLVEVIMRNMPGHKKAKRKGNDEGSSNTSVVVNVYNN